ncbi:MAG: hypothetical protein DYG90_00370 [Chloroflexi bacterium CFX6]|nr:hypothetical protein [Chloroflexi bacterium CFX6]
MGAELFRTRATGDDLATAFADAQAQSRHEDGHGGYTGTIAEKYDVVEVAVPDGVEPATFAAMVYAALDYFDGWQEAREDWRDLPAAVVAAVKRAAVAGDDKWGPAVAIQLAPGRWTIMGWASG